MAEANRESPMVVDTHVHCVPTGMRDEFFRSGLAALFQQFPAEQMKEPVESLLSDMDSAGVAISLVVTGNDLEVFEEYAETHPGRLFVAYLFDSRSPREGVRRLRRAVEKHPRLVKSVKTIFPYLGQHPAQKEFFPLYRYCENCNLPIQFHMGGDHRMEELSHVLYFARLCALFPNLSVVCLHAGGGQVSAAATLTSLWENVFIELEGLQLPEAEGSRHPGVLRYLVEQVGGGRLMFGSDRLFPEEKYFARVNAVRSLERETAEEVCWRTADRVYGLGIARKTPRRKRKGS